MSIENVKKFYEYLKENKSAAQELEEHYKSVSEKTMEKGAEAASEFAGKRGFDFTPAELLQFEKEFQELTEEELSEVNAGYYKEDPIYCIVLGFGWGCAGLAGCRVIGAGFCGAG